MRLKQHYEIRTSHGHQDPANANPDPQDRKNGEKNLDKSRQTELKKRNIKTHHENPLNKAKISAAREKTKEFS
jgi:hypothetical protein